VGTYPAPGLKPSEPWNEVGDADGPPFTVVPRSCLLSGTPGQVRTNYGGGYSTAAFYRDALGVVHLKGVTERIDDPFASDCDQAFSLPAGYRPAQREIHRAVGYNGSDYVPARIDVTLGRGHREARWRHGRLPRRAQLQVRAVGAGRLSVAEGLRR
jgi:hypothetical protein